MSTYLLPKMQTPNEFAAMLDDLGLTKDEFANIKSIRKYSLNPRVTAIIAKAILKNGRGLTQC